MRRSKNMKKQDKNLKGSKATPEKANLDKAEISEINRPKGLKGSDLQTSEVNTVVLEQQRVEESKYYLGAPSPEPFREEHFMFPEKYGYDHIVLLVRDPYWTHAYWEITPQTTERIWRENGEEAMRFAKLVLRVKDIQNTNPDKPNAYFDIDIAPGAKNWYISVMKPNTSYCVEIGYLLSSGRFLMITRSNYVMTPRAGVSEVLDEEWMSLEEYDKIYALSGGLNLGLSSAELRKRMKERMEQWITSGVPGSMFSPWKKRHEERKFFLWVEAELIIYGATMPDAKLSIQGVPKKLNPDGTFSARFALPNGVHSIPVSAVSADNVDKQTITPIVSRETK
jgi:hypothetical protein